MNKKKTVLIIAACIFGILLLVDILSPHENASSAMPAPTHSIPNNIQTQPPNDYITPEYTEASTGSVTQPVYTETADDSKTSPVYTETADDPETLPVYTAAATDRTAVTVYITETGRKYHRQGCQYLSKSCIPIYLNKAKAEGYTPCSKCHPPT